MRDDPVTDDQLDEPADVCVFDRLLAAGLSIERIEQRLTAGRIQVDGELVTDPVGRRLTVGGRKVGNSYVARRWHGGSATRHGR
jgi:hypothetical protein